METHFIITLIAVIITIGLLVWYVYTLQKEVNDKPSTKNLLLVPTGDVLYEKGGDRKHYIFTFDKDVKINSIKMRVKTDKKDIKPVFTIRVMHALSNKMLGVFTAQSSLNSDFKFGGKNITIPAGESIYFNYVEGMTDRYSQNLKDCLYDSKYQCKCEEGNETCDVKVNGEKLISLNYSN